MYVAIVCSACGRAYTNYTRYRRVIKSDVRQTSNENRQLEDKEGAEDTAGKTSKKIRKKAAKLAAKMDGGGALRYCAKIMKINYV